MKISLGMSMNTFADQSDAAPGMPMAYTLTVALALLAGCSEMAPQQAPAEAKADGVTHVVVTGSSITNSASLQRAAPAMDAYIPAPASVPSPAIAPIAGYSAPADKRMAKPALAGRMPPVMPGSAMAYQQGADKFPDKDANGVTLVSEQPVSTFSADVDTASYAFVRRLLNAGTMPPPAAVRVEEMVNYFPYKYALPTTRTQPFGVTTEVMPSPWKAGNQLVHIAVRGYDIHAAERPPANVVLLVDVSGSMGPADRLPLLKQGFRLFASQLRDEDRVTIVTYANGTQVALEPTSGKDKQKIIDALDNLHAGGGTAGGDGLQRAYAMAERNFDSKAVNRVIVATDGDFNLGITDLKQLERFIADKRKTGIYLSIFGVGLGNLNDALIQRLTQAGNGNAAYIDSLLEARKAMSEELGSTMFPIANDVKMQVEFNPEQVAAYRLVGYETRMLQRQDFNDDKVDAGDMGAGHAVTAIYEITPAAGADKLVDPLRYQKEGSAPSSTKAKHDELCFVKVRYKLPGETSSRLTEYPVPVKSARKSLDAVPEEQRFAVAVAAFAQRLRAERQLSDYSYADIAKLANSARGSDAEGYRAEFVKLVRMAETLDKVGPSGQN
jgi:Ca-activated chloride channel family protein